MTSLFKPVFAVVALVSAWASYAHAEQFDTSFNGSGRYTDTFPAQHRDAIAMLERPDGGLVLISSCSHPLDLNACLGSTFLNADGSLVSSQQRNFNGADTITGAAIDSRGRYVIAGTSLSGVTGLRNFRAMRLLPNGNVDASFGVAGYAEVDFNGLDDYANAVAIDADDNVIIVGEAGFSATDSDFGVVRLRGADGMLDTTFNGTGKKTVFFDLGNGSKFDRARGLAIAASGGRITVVGTAYDASIGVTGVDKVALARLNSDGTLDTSFCLVSCTFQGSYASINNGRRVYYFGSSTADTNAVTSVALLGNGDFYVVGASATSNGMTFSSRPAIARIFANGDYAAETVTAATGINNFYRSVQVSDATGQRVLVSGDFDVGHLVMQAFTSSLVPTGGYGDCMGSSAFCITGGGGVSDDGPDRAGLLSLDRSGRPLFAGTYVAVSGDDRKALFARFTNATGPKPDRIFRNGFQ